MGEIVVVTTGMFVGVLVGIRLGLLVGESVGPVVGRGVGVSSPVAPSASATATGARLVGLVVVNAEGS